MSKFDIFHQDSWRHLKYNKDYGICSYEILTRLTLVLSWNDLDVDYDYSHANDEYEYDIFDK